VLPVPLFLCTIHPVTKVRQLRLCFYQLDTTPSQVPLLCNQRVANSRVVEQQVLSVSQPLHIVFPAFLFGLDRRMALLSSWTSSMSTVAGALLALYSFYVVSVAIHRLYFSRYAKFPGPKLAGLTYGYMFYYDAIGGKGQYMHRIKEMHEEYSTCYTKPL